MKQDRNVELRKDLDALIAKYKAIPVKTGTVAKKKAKKIDISTLGMLKSAIEKYATDEMIDKQNGVEYTHIDKLRFVYDMEKKFSSIKDVTDLPFVRTYTKEERKAQKLGRNFWSVEPTGEYGIDCDTGHEYAAMAYAYMRNTGMTILSDIIFDMMKSDPERDKGLIVGFFYYIHCFLMGSGGIGYMLFDREIAKTSVNILLHNERKRKESNKLPLVWNYQKGQESVGVGRLIRDLSQNLKASKAKGREGENHARGY